MEKVIFDTNAYRYLVTNTKAKYLDRLVSKLKSKERQNNIEALMSSVVAKELLYHAANPQDASYFKCLKAAGAMYLHCASDDNKSYRMIASPELLISNTFYGLLLQRKVETNEAIGQMVFHSRGTSLHKIKMMRRNLFLNRTHIKESEEEFAASLQQLMLQIDPSTVSWQPFRNNPQARAALLSKIRSSSTDNLIALAYLSVVDSLLVQSGQISTRTTMPIMQNRAAQFVQWFPAPIMLYKQVLENMVQNEYDLTKKSRTNFVWDIQLMFNIGAHQIGSGNLYFVTNDKAMTQAAQAANSGLRVYTFEEYMEFMGLQADL